MPLHFVDSEGSDGWIEDDLSVSYAGPVDVNEAVESYVDEREPDAPRDEEVLQQLMIELYDRKPVREIERVDGLPETAPER